MATKAASPLRSLRLTSNSRPKLGKASRQCTTRTTIASIATFKIPQVSNEPNKHYIKGSPDRKGLEDALAGYQKITPLDVPLVVGGQQIYGQSSLTQANPSEHATTLATYSNANENDVKTAIASAMAVKPDWENMPFADRAAIFLKAADLISGKYRYEIMALTMLGQGKNAWQAEIDAAAELCDFLRFNVQYAQDLYADQPMHHAPGVWNRVEYRPLEGFVYAISPFNFTAIGGNLPCAPALMGNVVVWKPSPSAIASNALIHRILLEAGLPPNVIQFLPGDAEAITSAVLSSPDFASLHYTGSTAVFRTLYGQIAQGVAGGRYTSYPRIVGETGGKNFHLLHKSADVGNAVHQTLRGAFEYQGQKCSATSRAYIPSSLFPEFSARLAEEVEVIPVGPPTDFQNFCGPVIHAGAFARLKAAIDDARADPACEILAGGSYDDSTGYFVKPTVVKVKDPKHFLMQKELFGPVLALYEYPDSTPSAFSETCELVAKSSEYALTGAVFAQDRFAVREAEERLRQAAGNFYVNCKSTGAVVGQQPFGGGRASGTNDKAGSKGLLSRFVSTRALKEEFVALGHWRYPSNDI